MKVFESSEGNVWKYVFDTEFQSAITEAVLYRYDSFAKRTVLCISVQSGCPVGCTFCGTGNQFLRNLSADEIVSQVKMVFDHMGLHDINSRCEKLQIMFMSMGEPFMNYNNVATAIQRLHSLYHNADLLISTIAPNAVWRYGQAFIKLSKEIPKVGLQFSIHASTDGIRDSIIPYNNKMTLCELRNYGVEWWHQTGRKPYINYCVTDEFSIGWDGWNLLNLFPPNVFCLTLSVLCSPDETMKDAGYRNLDDIREYEQWFQQQGYDTRVFDPAGQDDIGGGCGQLWYVQQYINKELNCEN